MRNLDPPRYDPMAVYDAVIEHKEKPYKPRLEGLRGRIVCAYLRYYARTDRLERLPRLGRRITVDEAASLKSCYDSKTDAWKRIYSAIRKLSKKCSYCGLRDVVGLDHYLRKGGSFAYPEYYILPVNLVPACDRCNDNDDFRDAAGRRAVIHPYFDRIPRECLLFADVRVVRGLPEATFRIDLGRCPDASFGALMERHFVMFGLERLYNDTAASDDGLPDIIITLKALSPSTNREGMRDFLYRHAEGRASALGANDFKVALYRGAAASDDFLDFCAGGGR